MSLFYQRQGDIIEITIRDATMKKIEFHKFNIADKKLGNKILKHVQDKYGFSPEIAPSEGKEFWK